MTQLHDAILFSERKNELLKSAGKWEGSEGAILNRTLERILSRKQILFPQQFVALVAYCCFSFSCFFVCLFCYYLLCLVYDIPGLIQKLLCHMTLKSEIYSFISNLMIEK